MGLNTAAAIAARIAELVKEVALAEEKIAYYTAMADSTARTRELAYYTDKLQKARDSLQTLRTAMATGGAVVPPPAPPPTAPPPAAPQSGGVWGWIRGTAQKIFKPKPGQLIRFVATRVVVGGIIVIVGANVAGWMAADRSIDFGAAKDRPRPERSAEPAPEPEKIHDSDNRPNSATYTLADAIMTPEVITKPEWSCNKMGGAARVELHGTSVDYNWTFPQTIGPEGESVTFGGSRQVAPGGSATISIGLTGSAEFDKEVADRHAYSRSDSDQPTASRTVRVFAPAGAEEFTIKFGIGYNVACEYLYRLKK